MNGKSIEIINECIECEDCMLITQHILDCRNGGNFENINEEEYRIYYTALRKTHD